MLRRVHESLLPWQAISIKYLSVCVCARARACLFPSTWACAWACLHVALLIQQLVWAML